ncbi:hypothetical protein LOK49_LG02G02191 [Camellia lanceoleosa]|uniref:Uncharacterized protein n=1 Tax=Camellia lanceoleosa TaxID=1840588 RepID=A0ACC0ISB1_9ERIC|nr:hypothetical protein LOK49_LG02G02191 [Camellia lanceoleosa]
MALLKFTDTIKSSIFGHELDMHKIASNGSRVIDGALLTVDYWQQGLVLEHLFIEHFAVWIQFHGLPLECYTEEAGFRLGQAVGEVIWIDLDPVLLRNIQRGNVVKGLFGEKGKQTALARGKFRDRSKGSGEGSLRIQK